MGVSKGEREEGKGNERETGTDLIAVDVVVARATEEGHAGPRSLGLAE